MDFTEYFSADYFAAREQFLTGAQACGAHIASYPLLARGPDNTALTIDTAYLGAPAPRRLLVVTSGTHGIEGFAGSAMQRRLLDTVNVAALAGSACGLLLIHSLNPYGFAWRRRVNEHNVDLNRNGLEQFPGPANAGYALLNAWLNPQSPPRRDGFLARAAWLSMRHGVGTLKQAIAGGQYAWPRGIFFGGERREESTQRLLEILRSAPLPAAEFILWLDIHTGLGRYGRYKLLTDWPADHAAADAMRQWFGAANVSGNRPDASVAYRVSGGLTELAARTLGTGRLYGAVLEIGTYSVVRMLSTLRDENRAHFYSESAAPQARRAQRAISEMFCPRDRRWRQRVVAHGDAIFSQAQAALLTARNLKAG